ncbi:MAG: aminoacyl-tRNA hydrolase [Bacteroidota bacterium]|nr:aminoacyl-tRNA hydrolase [Bacteroidota bacterium]
MSSGDLTEAGCDGHGNIFCVVGLGNPGARYAATRHNVGFAVIAELAMRFHAEPERDEGDCRITAVSYAETALLLCRPWTYMNRSGEAVARLVREGRIDPSRTLIVLDDIALPLGSLRIRRAGSSGGHRGLASIIGAIGTEDIPRLRCGIGPLAIGIEAAEFVLAPFEPHELAAVHDMIDRAASAVESILREGWERAMSRWNSIAPTDTVQPASVQGEDTGRTDAGDISDAF